MVLVLVEHDGPEVDELSLQAIALARELATGEPVSALLVGAGGREAGPARGPRSWDRSYRRGRATHRVRAGGGPRA